MFLDVRVSQIIVSKIITYLHVYAINKSKSQGTLKLGHMSFPCLLGKTGRKFIKREGDGASPIGKWKLERLYFRPDKLLKPKCMMPSLPLNREDGWCDARGHRCYNRFIKTPFAASHENLWRNDQAYDLVVTTSHNQRPRQQNGGSAIFFHVINKGARSTEGCIALTEKHLRIVLEHCSNQTYLVI
jgi:L,D-peptidoglycan transpeptidase YkuD (ErfK/YbiS/YcfS/YnhG family)